METAKLLPRLMYIKHAHPMHQSQLIDELIREIMMEEEKL